MVRILVERCEWRDGDGCGGRSLLLCEEPPKQVAAADAELAEPQESKQAQCMPVVRFSMPKAGLGDGGE